MHIFADHRTLPVAPVAQPSQGRAAKLYRFLAGAPLDGYVRTDATFLRPATVVLTATGHASRWHKMPGWKRSAWRVGPPAGVVSAAAGFAVHPLATEASMGVLAATGSALVVRRVRRWTSERRHRRDVVQPLLKSLAGPLGLPLTATAEKWLIVPKNPGRPGQITRVWLPDTWLGEDVQQLAVTRLVGRWLDKPVEAVRWHLTSSPRFAEFTPAPEPPASVPWKYTGDPYRMFVGKDARGSDVFAETLSDTPHLAVVGGSGSGKTTSLTLPLVHARMSGVLVDIIDLKRMSYTERKEEHPDGIAGDPTRPSGTVTGVRIHTTLQDSIRAVAEFLASATAVALMQQQGQDTSHIPPRILLTDEFGSFAGGAKAWWKGPGRQKTPYVVPFWTHVALMQGRALEHRVVLGAHQMSLTLFGSSDARDLFSARLLVGESSAEKWITTFGRVRKPAWDAKAKGRGAFGALGSQPSVVQVAYLPQAEANAILKGLPQAPAWFDRGESAPWLTQEFVEEVEDSYSAGRWVPGWEWMFEDSKDADGSEEDSVYVTPGERHAVTRDTSGRRDVVPVRREHPEGPRDVTPGPADTVTIGEHRLTLVHGGTDDLPAGPQTRYSLASAARAGIVPMTADALRQAKKRGPFPESGPDGLWSGEDLVRWFASRQSAG